jgi:hypothetical protein
VEMREVRGGGMLGETSEEASLKLVIGLICR